MSRATTETGPNKVQLELFEAGAQLNTLALPETGEDAHATTVAIRGYADFALFSALSAEVERYRNALNREGVYFVY